MIPSLGQLTPSLHSREMRALVTGGTGRIGSAIAGRLRSENWSVLAAGRAEGNLADVEATQALVARAVDELGGLDLLVNAAGEGFMPKPVADVIEADWDGAFGATAKGTFFATQAAAPHLRESRGLVIMIEDVAAYEPWPSFAAHSAAKAAQAMLTRVFARALAPEVPGVRDRTRPGRGLARAGGAPRCRDAPGQDRIARRRGRRGSVPLGSKFVTGTTLVVDGARLLQTERPRKP